LNTKLLDTRKTTPCNRIVEKLAVRLGGGTNHRFGLFDMIMIKDNHVDFAGGISNAISSTQSYLKEKEKSLKIEIEVRNFDELNEVIDTGGVDRIMLDNFSPADLSKAVNLIGNRFETEASGGITIDNIRKYAETGVDFISVGALTHQIKSLDLSLKTIEINVKKLFNKITLKVNKLGYRISERLRIIVLPGFDGMPLYDVLVFFLRGLFKGVLTYRAAAIAYNFFFGH